MIPSMVDWNNICSPKISPRRNNYLDYLEIWCLTFCLDLRLMISYFKLKLNLVTLKFDLYRYYSQVIHYGYKQQLFKGPHFKFWQQFFPVICQHLIIKGTSLFADQSWSNQKPKEGLLYMYSPSVSSVMC